jgi:hypothetical protein
MKHNLKGNKVIQYAGFALLILIVVFGSVAATFPITTNSQLSGEENIKTVINDYFALRYDAQKTLKQDDYSAVTDAADVGWLQKEKDRLEVLRTIAETTQFNFIDYKFTLDYQNIAIRGNKAMVVLLESNELYYPTATAPSILSNLEHVITLKTNTKGEWRINKDEYLDDTIKLLKVDSKDEILKNIKKNFLDLQRLSSRQDVSPLPANISPALTTYPYNTSAAVTYADTNYNKAGPVPQYVRNQPGWTSGWPTSYKLYTSDDCTNFVSQAVFEGVSYTASDANYFYPDSSHYMNWWYYKFSTTVDGSGNHPIKSYQ